MKATTMRPLSRRMVMGSAGALGLSMIAPPTRAAPVTDESAAPFQAYLKMLEEARAAVLASPYAERPVERSQALYYVHMMQAFAFNIYMAPRQAFPSFYSETTFLPIESSWGAPCPDFMYHWTFLDGARTYRIYGKRGTTKWAEIQAQRGFWGDPDQSLLGTWDFDNFAIEPDGSFEIIASPKRHKGNWMKLDPKAPNIALLVRDTQSDWDRSQGLTIAIDCLDRTGDEPVALSTADYEKRLGQMAYFTMNSIKRYSGMIEETIKNVGFNAFYSPAAKATINLGGNPRAAYVKMIYDLAPDDALIIETAIPKARYWSLQLADFWYQTTDYAFHHSSLNDTQAHLDGDGKVRLVLSKKDPGVPNWMDPVDNLRGLAQWRWYLSEEVLVPKVTKVPVKDVRKHLPLDTPKVSAKERKAIVAARRAAVARRFGA